MVDGEERKADHEQRAHRVCCIRRLLVLAGVIAFAACGGSKTPAERVAECLNRQGFLVQSSGSRVEGTSPGGIAFKVAAATGAIDDSGNPGGGRLSKRARAEIRACLPARTRS